MFMRDKLKTGRGLIKMLDAKMLDAATTTAVPRFPNSATLEKIQMHCNDKATEKWLEGWLNVCSKIIDADYNYNPNVAIQDLRN